MGSPRFWVILMSAACGSFIGAGLNHIAVPNCSPAWMWEPPIWIATILIGFLCALGATAAMNQFELSVRDQERDEQRQRMLR